MVKKKRKTKAEREQEQKDALLQRISDIYSGACGAAMDDPETAFPTIADLSRVIPAVRELFGQPCDDWWGWRAVALGDWETPEKAVEFLFENGFRADSRWEALGDE